LPFGLEYPLFKGPNALRGILQAPAERGHFFFENLELFSEFIIRGTVANIGIFGTHLADLLGMRWTLSGLSARRLTGMGLNECSAKKWAPGSSSHARATMVCGVPIPPHEEV
jgi:hypothetical protein